MQNREPIAAGTMIIGSLRTGLRSWGNRIGYETADHRPGAGNRGARSRSHGRPAARGERTICPCQRRWPRRQAAANHCCCDGIRECAGARARHRPNHGKRGARRRRIPQAVPQSGKHRLPRGGWSLFLPVCARLRKLDLAASRPGFAWPGPFQVPPLCGHDAGVPLPERELFLACAQEIDRRRCMDRLSRFTCDKLPKTSP